MAQNPHPHAPTGAWLGDRQGARARGRRATARGRRRAPAGASAVATAATAVAVEWREPARSPAAGTPRQRCRHFRSQGRPRWGEGADARSRGGGRGRGLGRALALGCGREGLRGGSAGRQDPSPAELQGRQELSAVLLRAGLSDRVPRDEKRGDF